MGCIFSPTVDEIPPQPEKPFEKPEDVIDALSRAYQTRNHALFTSLLANDPDRNAEYLFLLSAATELGETQWGFAEEARIHQRMFNPESPPPGESQPAPELWLEGMTITLTKQEAFTERPDMYTTYDPPGPLDPTIWRATDSRYQTYVFFDMQGTDYKVEGEANFVVIEDLTKNVGDAGKFLLYIWEDIATTAKPKAGDPT